MKKVKIVYRHTGEISYTEKSPYCLLPEFTGSLEETKQCCYSSDDFRLVPVKLYEVSEIELPNWIDPEFYIREPVKYKYFKYFCDRFNVDIDQFNQQNILDFWNMSSSEKIAAFKLLKVKKFRSSFRASLRQQLDKWLSDANRKFSSPFSRNQWNAIIDSHTQMQATYYHKYGAF